MIIDKDTQLFGSFSKQAGSTGCKFFNAAFQKYDINAIYKSFSVDDIGEAFDAAKTLWMAGFAVAMPFKIKVRDYCDCIEKLDDKYIDNSMRPINTVINDGKGNFKGYNTDIIGVQDIINHYMNFTENKYEQLHIIGNGGLAASVKIVCSEMGIPCIIHERYTPVGEIVDMKDLLIYNCTPLDLSFLAKDNIFIDCRVGTPDGDKLYKIQSRAQFKLYTGIDYEED